jgi:hypothetical protein
VNTVKARAMPQAEKSEAEPDAFDMNGAVNQAIGACGGDLLATVRSLVVANNFLMMRNAELVKELDWAWHWISPGYTRSTNKRRMKSGDE